MQTATSLARTIKVATPTSETCFKLTPGTNNKWTQKIIYSFKGYAKKDGAYPYFAGVTIDSAGNLYGSTYQGGSSAANNLNYGTVYKLAAGTYKERCSGVSAPLATDTIPNTNRSSSMESSMARPTPGESMDRACMRLHRSQGIQGSALVPLSSRRRALWLGGDFSFRFKHSSGASRTMQRQWGSIT